MAEMQTFRLRRDGDTPLVFRGEAIAESDTREHQGDGQNRWHQVTIYRTAGGRYVVAVEYHTQWQGESDRYDAVALGVGTPDVAELLRMYDGVIPPGIGYPPSPNFADRQARMEASLRSRWERMIGVLLDRIGAEERVE